MSTDRRRHSGLWSSHRLADFLVAVGESANAREAAAIAAERAAEAFDADVAAVAYDQSIIGSVGFAAADVSPDGALLRAITDESLTIDVPGAGSCEAIIGHGSGVQPLHLLVGRVAPAHFSPEESGLLRSMARVLSMALDTFRLVDSLTERQALLERLSVIQRSIARRAALDDVLHAISVGLVDLLDDDLAIVRLVDPVAPHEHVLAASHGVARQSLVGIHRLPVSAGVTGRAIADERLVVSDGSTDSPQPIVGFVEGDVGAMMAAPVHDAGTVVGAVAVGSRDPQRVYSAGEREALLLFAEHASIALTDAKAVEGMERALYDPLTSLPNRVLFSERLARANARDAVLFVDLDRFKAVNDSLGHAAGDELLIAVAHRLRDCVRPGDIVARHGGDEFTVLLTDLGDPAEADAVADRIIRSLERPIPVASREIVISASIGIALASACGQVTDLVQQADVAMYHAKQSGRSRYATFSRALGDEARRRLDIELELRSALRRGELSLHYQPLVRLADRSIVAAEALLRWERPGRPTIPTGELIEIAEASGLIVPIGEWVIREVCAQLHHWTGITPPGFRMHLNVSVRQLAEFGLDEHVAASLQEFQLPPSAITLELTESILIGQEPSARAVVDRLRGIGVELSLDDFGQGYSSLAYLADLDIQSIKVDRSFVRRLDLHAAPGRIVRHVVALAHELGMYVVAEGIETPEQCELLRIIDCDQGQGYLFSRPLAEAELAVMLSPRTRTDSAVSRSLVSSEL